MNNNTFCIYLIGIHFNYFSALNKTGNDCSGMEPNISFLFIWPNSLWATQGLKRNVIYKCRGTSWRTVRDSCTNTWIKNISMALYTSGQGTVEKISFFFYTESFISNIGLFKKKWPSVTLDLALIFKWRSFTCEIRALKSKRSDFKIHRV